MRLIKVLLGLVVVFVIAVVGLLFLLPGEKIAKLAADQVKAQTGRDLIFDGEVSLSYYPTLGVATGPVTLGNADWSDAGPMFQAQSAAIGVDMMALIGGNIRIKRIEVVGPQVLLEKARDGRVNWDLLPASDETTSTTDSGGTGTAFTLDKLIVKDASLRYVDHGGDTVEVSDLDARLNWGGAGQAAEVQLSLNPYGEVIEIDATVNDLNGLLEGTVSELTAKVSAAGAKIDFTGRASTVPEVAGVIDADIPNPDALMAALGQGGAGLPGAAAFGGEITYTSNGRMSLRKGKVTLGKNAANIAADVDMNGAKPVVTAQVVAGALDFSAFLDSGESGDGEAGDGWSKEAIDASSLAGFDGEITLGADSINLGTLQFGRSRVKIANTNSRAVITLQELQGYEGVISGEFVANNRSGLSVGGAIKVTDIAMQPLLIAMADLSRFTGTANANMSFLGSGNSVHAIMNSLKGDGSMVVGQGTISGIDLDKLFRGTPGGGTTVFDSMSASWTIAKGVMNNEDLRMELPSILAKGAGTIGLGAQDINYTFTPQLRNEAEDGIAVPVRVKGPWADPRIWPDLEAVVKQNFDEEIDQVKDEAKEKLKKKLGIEESEDGKSLEEELEDKVKDKLLDLLGGD